ncbi:MAG: succinylglutamate-semialdehyde dehydrogenase [Pseudomonadota bacterium]
MHTLEHYVDGLWVVGTGVPLTTHDPATGLLSWQGNAAGIEQIDQACSAAHSAFANWAATTLAQRIELCERFQTLVTVDAETLAQTITAETGKPAWEARSEVASIAAKIGISIRAQATRAGVSATPVAEGTSVVRHRPHGVLAVLGPYNFPGHLPNGHIVPALLAGNTVVFKPSEYAPRTAIAITRLWERAGLPHGVLNLLYGDRVTGQSLVEHLQIDGVLFTGSRHVGLDLHHKFAGQPEKMLALEMGGNNPLVVWQVNNLDAAVHHTVMSAFISAGQRCTCARRIIVEDSLDGETFVRRLVDVAARLGVGVGNTAHPEPFMGPVISAAAAERLLAAQDMLLRRGGVSLLRMRQLVPETGLLSPGIIDVSNVLDIADEEWFGPLMQIIRVRDFTAAIDAANATRYGLAAGLLSDDEACWLRFLQASHAGVVNWNRPTTGASSNAPFGGIGYSGNHRPSAFYAADYCAHPVASVEATALEMPTHLAPGLSFAS